MNANKDPQARFWVEAKVSIAKSAVFLGCGEADLDRGDLMSASINAYYSLFHLSLTLMWLLPGSMPQSLHEDLIKVRDAGEELPNKITSHKKAENFLRAGQVNLPDPNLISLYQRALTLREFAIYGPRVTYNGDQPFVGTCSFQTRNVREIVQAMPDMFVSALRAAFPQTAYEGNLAPIVVDGAIDLLRGPEFPFKNWYSKSVFGRAEVLINGLRNQA
jgi:hypothetical protein